MLALTRDLDTGPAVLLLGELSMGLAPLVVAELYELVAEIARQGVAVLVVEQFAAAVLKIADHAAVLARGRVQCRGTPTAPRTPNSPPTTGGPDMTAPPDARADRFVRELAELKIPNPAAALWLRLGGLFMAAGLVPGALAFPLAHATDKSLAQGDALAIGLGGVAATVVGGALFLRYSLTGFLRFWLARQSFDLDRLGERLTAPAPHPKENRAMGSPHTGPPPPR